MIHDLRVPDVYATSYTFATQNQIPYELSDFRNLNFFEEPPKTRLTLKPEPEVFEVFEVIVRRMYII